MHVHASQPNPYAQLDSLRSAQRAAAKREAERVRKELLEFPGESDFSDLAVTQSEEERQESQGHSKRGSKRNAQVQQSAMEQETADPAGADAHISDWA
jgi:hypothetical protein